MFFDPAAAKYSCIVDETLGTGYLVELPGGVVARCNPVTAPPDCDDELLAAER
jgi:hypothetical protein